MPSGSISGIRLPARSGMGRSRSCHRARLRLPNLGGILGDRVVAGEFPGARHVQGGFARPSVLIGVQRGQPLVRLDIGFKVGQVHVMISVRQERIPRRSKDAGLVAAEMVGEDQVQRGAGLGLVVVTPVRIVPAAATWSAVKPNRKKFSSPASSAISIVAPSRVPTVSAPFIMKFMLLVPRA
jgi:hypothetical protein